MRDRHLLNMAADANKVLEGSLKYRDGKKWKQRWCVLQRLSPVADCLHLFLYKEHSECYKLPTKSTIPLEDFYGAQYGFSFDKENHVLAIICRNRVINLAFHSHETLDFWRLTILQHLGEGRPYEAVLVKAPQFTKLSSGPVIVYVHRASLCLTTPCLEGVPPRFLGSWRVGELGRFGIIGNKFCFEVEDKNAFALQTAHQNELNHVLLNIAQGRSMDSPPLPPKLCKTAVADSVVQKPRLGSPVYKSLSLDRSSIHRSENSKSETDGSAVDPSTILRRQLSEPREFSASGEVAANNVNDKAGCYHNIWCCSETSGKEIPVSDRRFLCENFVRRCLELPGKPLTDAKNSPAISGSLSKICCLPSSEGCGVSRDGSVSCRSYVATSSSDGRDRVRLRQCSSACAGRPSSARYATRRASGDVRFGNAAEETQSLLNCNYVDNRSIGTSSLRTEGQQRRTLAERRASEDPSSSKDPLKPLPYVDLRRFDGDAEEGYLYYLKGPQQTRKHSSDSATPVRQSMYANLPMPKTVKETHSDAGVSAPAIPAVGGRASFHASLKRPNKFSIPAKDLLSSAPPPPSSAGSHSDLRHDSMLRSSSYYNVRLNMVVPPPAMLHKMETREKTSAKPRQLPPTPSTPATATVGVTPTQEAVGTSHPEDFGVDPGAKSAPDTDYITMCGQSEADDCAIFFTVDIPKRSDSRTIEHARSSSRLALSRSAGSFGMVPPAAAAVNDDASGYIDMSGANSTSAVVSCNPSTKPPECVVDSALGRPRLRHSRSLENELDSSPEGEGLRRIISRRTSHDVMPLADYIPMGNRFEGRTDCHVGQLQALAKPFDNLISHERYKLPVSIDQKDPFLSLNQKERTLWSNTDVGTFMSDTALNFLSQRSNSLKSSKSSGLFSRFFRTSSSVKEKRTLADSKNSSASVLTNAANREQTSFVENQAAGSFSCAKPDSFSISSCSSSLERLGPPPPVPVGQQFAAGSVKSSSEHYINLSSVSSGLPPSLSEVTSGSTSEYLNIAPPPLPPKGVNCVKNHEIEAIFRSVTVPVEKVRQVEKQPLRSITEDEQEVPPLPEKARIRSAYQSKLLSSSDSPSSTHINSETSPKPPVPPRSAAPTTTTSVPGTSIAQRSPRFPLGSDTKSRKPNLSIDIVSNNLERRGSREDTVATPGKNFVQPRHLSDLRQRVRVVSEMSTVSLSSGEEGRPSPALTTMRPRYGKEYQCVDRRRLFEDGSPFTPQRSPSMASSVFTFDSTPMVLRSGNGSSGENSPKYPPSLRSRLASEHMNSSRNVSPIVLDAMLDSPPPAEPSVMLNYAEIDLSTTELAPASAVQRVGSKPDNDKTEYALIDLIATSAASRVGREHARQREDILERKERFVEALSSESKENKSGNGRGIGLLERKGSAEPRRTPSIVSRDQRFGLF